MDKPSATDWREAGYRADATRVLNLYRRSFDNDGKRLARTRSVAALRASGVQTVICLWGGGLDAEELVAAGFRVIAVDNGSMIVTDGDRDISDARKRRALQYAAEAGGYEWRWGDVTRYLHEADGALLDFHGPWAGDKRRAVRAARHMAAVVVVLVPSRDVSADASSSHERQMAYQLFLKMAWADRPRWEAIQSNGHVRRLTDYHEDQGRHVFVYLLGRKHVQIERMTINDRAKMRRDVHERVRAKGRAYYRRLSPDAKQSAYAKVRHAEHLRTGRLPGKPCVVCGASRARVACSVCGETIQNRPAQSRYCSNACSRIMKTDKQRERQAALPKSPRYLPCVACGRQTEAKRNAVRITCSPECAHERKLIGANAYTRRKRLAAVSGTAAEAVNNEVAA